MNISANFLGLGGVATPYGIDAAKRMQNEKHGGYSSAMLFAVNATNVQLIPTSVIALRVALQSGAPYDILPPVLICSAVALAINMLFTFLIAHRLPKLLRRKKSGVWERTSGAGARL
jgi:spore maturation protein A